MSYYNTENKNHRKGCMKVFYVIACLIGSIALADCTDLKGAYEEAVYYCNLTQDITHTCQAVAEVTNPLTLGLGGLACAFPAIGAEISCQMKDSRKKWLDACEASATKDVLTKAWVSEVNSQSERWVRSHVDPLIKKRDDYILGGHNAYDRCIISGYNELIAQEVAEHSDDFGAHAIRINEECSENVRRVGIIADNIFKKDMLNWRDQLEMYGYDKPERPALCTKVKINGVSWLHPNCADYTNVQQVWWGVIP